MSLLNKNINDITFEDVENLVYNERPQENEFLDYKREINRDKIHELIAAFANTYGGWILVGIDEDEENRPAKIVGVDEDSLGSVIESICVDRISPPVLCSSRYLENADKSLKVFVIKIDESDLTPHAVDYNTTVYIRVKEQKKPYKKADLDQIEWLKNKRQRYVDKRHYLIKRARKRCQNVVNDSSNNELISEFLIIPMFPKSRLIESNKLYDFASSDIGSIDGSGMYVDLKPNESRSSSDSISWWPENHASFKLYCETNCYGLYFNLVQYIRKVGDNKEYYSIHDILWNLFTNLRVGVTILSKLGYNGSIYYSYKLSGFFKKQLTWEIKYNSDPGYKLHLCPIVDNEIGFEKSLQVSDLCDKINEEFTFLCNEIIFGLGIGKSAAYDSKRILSIFLNSINSI